MFSGTLKSISPPSLLSATMLSGKILHRAEPSCSNLACTVDTKSCLTIPFTRFVPSVMLAMMTVKRAHQSHTVSSVSSTLLTTSLVLPERERSRPG